MPRAPSSWGAASRGPPVVSEPWWRRLIAGRSSSGPRVTGVPPSANGASSFHLAWIPPGGGGWASGSSLPIGAAVTLEVLSRPAVPRLYFWALQVDVATSDRRRGGAHLGLQWHPGHPGSTAVNWGGYDENGVELPGTRSGLPSATHNANTRDLDWIVERPYRLLAERASDPDTGDPRWRGTVSDLVTGNDVVVRDLVLDGDHVVGVTMWSEVFARCDDPAVVVRWSEPEVLLADGSRTVPAAVAVNYQRHADGGCANTDSSPDVVGLLQRTASERRTPQGTRLPLRR